MIAGSNRKNSEANRTVLESLTWLLQHLHLASGELEDRGTVRRALEATAAAWPGKLEDNWWKWTVESCKSLGLRATVIDCRIDELIDAIRSGVHVMLWTPEHGCVVVTESRRNKVLLGETTPTPAERWIKISELRQLLGNPDRSQIIRCAFTQSDSAIDSTSVMFDHDRTPLSRFLALLRTESSDIAVILLFSVFTGILAMATPLAIESLVNTVAFGRFLQPVLVLAIILLAFLAFSAALQGLKTYVAEIIQWRLFARVAADLSFRLPRVRWEQLDNRNAPELVNRFFDVVTVQKVSSHMLLDGISVVLNALVGMTVLAFYHPWLLGFDVVMLGLIAIAVFVVGRGAVATAIKESKSKYSMAAWLEDIARCPHAFRHAGGGEFALERSDRLTFEYLTNRRKHFRILMRQIVFFLGMQALASTILLALGGWLVITGQLTLGQLVAAELIVTIIVSSFSKLGKHIEAFYDVLASVDKLGYLFDLKIEPQSGIQRSEPREPAHIELCSVGYRYPDGPAALSDLRADITSGSRWAITGGSGTGKSTLLDILFGLRSPTFGHVLMDGIDPEDMRPDMLRDEVAMIRDIEIFQGSISENVTIHRANISLSEVRESLEAVGLLETVLSLPEGLETQLTGPNCRLTPNQLRKLMIARGIVGNPRLLLVDGILDELPDHEAEELAAVLAQAGNPWTLVLVTGRESIRRFCDRELNLPTGSARPLPA